MECFNSGYCEKLRTPTITGAVVPCINGFAGEYPCLNVDLLSFIDFDGLGCSGAQGNDIWGWTTDDSGVVRDFAIFCCTNGVSYVEITDPTNPKVIGITKTASTASTWRDVKVFKNHAYIVSEARNHGMQVVDLTLLLNQKAPGPNNQIFAVANYTDQMGSTTQRSTHNIAINEETGIAYLVGCKTCAGGLLMVDISTPWNPQYAGCYSADGYTHDTQCVIYRETSPDERWHGKEICFALNEDTLTIVDVTDKKNPVMISRVPYYGARYTHQGWLTKNQKYLLVDDELDEMYNTYDTTKRTVTYVWDVSNLGAPRDIYQFQSPVQSIDHNQYTEEDYVFQANYASGLRIWNGMNGEIAEPTWRPSLVGFFDVHPDADVADFYGSWSTYPYFASANNKNTIVVSSIEKGLFVLNFDKSKHHAKPSTD